MYYIIYMYSSIGNWDHPHNHCESTRQPVGEIARCRPASGMAVSAIVICGSGDIGSYLILHCILYIYISVLRIFYRDIDIVYFNVSMNCIYIYILSLYVYEGWSLWTNN